MNFVAIIGPPAVGKLTVGRILKTALGYRLLHNHMTFDMALTLHEYGSSEFFDLCDALRFSCLHSALNAKLSGVIMTFCAGSSEDLDFLNNCFKAVRENGGDCFCIALHARVETLIVRVQNTDRQSFAKLQAPDLLVKALDARDYSIVPDGVPVLRLATDSLTPAEVSDAVEKFIESTHAQVRVNHS